MTRKPVSATNKKRGPERSEMRKAAEAAGMSRGQMYRSLHDSCGSSERSCRERSELEEVAVLLPATRS